MKFHKHLKKPLFLNHLKAPVIPVASALFFSKMPFSSTKVSKTRVEEFICWTAFKVSSLPHDCVGHNRDTCQEKHFCY